MAKYDKMQLNSASDNWDEGGMPNGGCMTLPEFCRIL